jgi:hypothetical protein
MLDAPAVEDCVSSCTPMSPTTPVPSCPRCGAPMRHEVLDGHLGRSVSIDLCLSCQAFWFDARESLQLSPSSTLRLFQLIGDVKTAAAPAAQATPACPRCRLRLRLTRDMQRSTRFEYLKCPKDHGRLTTFFNFLREKDFIRPLSAAQLAELRQTMAAVNCSNCGAPVDLAKGSACAHCQSPLSILDMGQAEKLVAQLKDADRTGRGVDPALPMSLIRARRDAHAAFDAFERESGWMTEAGSAGLVGAGVSFVARWLRGG